MKTIILTIALAALLLLASGCATVAGIIVGAAVAGGPAGAIVGGIVGMGIDEADGKIASPTSHKPATTPTVYSRPVAKETAQVEKPENRTARLIESLSDDGKYEDASRELVNLGAKAEPEIRAAMDKLVSDSKEYYRLSLVLKQIKENERPKDKL